MEITHTRVLYFLLIVTISFLYIPLSYIRTNDASFQTLSTLKREVPGHVWLISYADGKDVHFSNQNVLVQSAVNKGIDAFIMYNKGDLGEEFVRKNAHTLSLDFGAGNWIWKPYIIQKTLAFVPENDIVLYFDAGIKIIKDLTPLINLTKDNDMIVFERPVKNRRYTKRDAMVLMGMDDEKYLDQNILAGGLVFFRNTKKAREFVDEWVKYCEDPRIVTDIPSENTEFADFQVNFHDQTVLTLLHYRNPQGQLAYQYNEVSGVYFDHHRRRTQDKLAASSSVTSYVISKLLRPDVLASEIIDFFKFKLAIFL
jgi:hypothetical protein